MILKGMTRITSNTLSKEGITRISEVREMIGKREGMIKDREEIIGRGIIIEVDTNMKINAITSRIDSSKRSKRRSQRKLANRLKKLRRWASILVKLALVPLSKTLTGKSLTQPMKRKMKLVEERFKELVVMKR
jgi:hypothetical protein